MLILSFLSFFGFLVYLYFGVFILRNNPKKDLNRIFFLITLCFMIWSFGYLWMNLSIDQADLLFWYRIASIGWCMVPAFTLHMGFLFTQKQVIFKNPLHYLWIYFPGVFFTVYSFLGRLFIQDIYIRDGVLVQVSDIYSFGFWGYVCYNFLYVAWFVLLLLYYRKKTSSLRVKKQSAIILSTALTAVVLTYFSNIIAVILGLNLPVLGHLFFLIWVLGMLFAVVRYELLSVASNVSSEQIIAQMMDLVFILDQDARILKINSQVEKILGYAEKELFGQELAHLINNDRSKQVFKDALAWLKSDFPIVKNMEIQLKSKNGKKQFFNISMSSIQDQMKEKIGIALVGHDIREKIELQKKNQTLEKELLLAKEIIMDNLLPLSLPKNYGLKISAFYRPMIQVGGDFYDFLKVREPYLLGIFISDVSGHGVSAALMTSMVKTLLETAGKKRMAPSQLLSYINEKMIHLSGGHFLTAFYGVYNKKTQELTYSRASHNYPILIRGNEMFFLESKGKLLGIMSNLDFEEKKIKLYPKDKIIFYTDGLTESFNYHGIAFEEKLSEILLQNTGKDIEELIQLIYESLIRHRGSFEFDDDVCLIGIEVE